MKRFGSLLKEVKGEKAHKQAVEMGLKYKGFGYWVNPTTGQVEYKTENEQLVPVEPDVEAEKAGKDPDAAGMAAPGGAGMAAPAAPGAMGLAKIQQAAQAAGEPLGDAPEPGEEQVAQDLGWESGPEGDTCVNDQEKPDSIPVDTFVGKQNNQNWAAGPDGSNYTTVEREDMFTEETGDDMNLTDRMSRVSGAEKPGDLMKQMMKLKTPQGDTNKAAASAFSDMGDTGQGRELRGMMGWAQRSKNDELKAHMMKHQMRGMPARLKDDEVVKGMNSAIQPLLKDPEYDMNQYDEDGDYLDEGAFGQTFVDNNGNVVKSGFLGPDELKALHAMKDNPSFPNLINAKFETPFTHKSTAYNNPDGEDRRISGESMYWDPDEASDFDHKFPGAQGTYAMSMAKGQPIFNVFDDMDEEMQDKVMRNFWRSRGQLHKAGFSHNDMHGGNVFADPETGEVNIIDLGLAKEGKVSALMEALGGLDYEQGEDYQLASHVSGSNLPERLRETFDTNRGEVEQAIMDTISMDDDDWDDITDAGYSPTRMRSINAMDDLLRGGIRQRNEDLDQVLEDLPALKQEGFIDNLLKMIYNDVGNSELADRMSDAFERRQADSDALRNANFTRSVKGQARKPLIGGMLKLLNQDD